MSCQKSEYSGIWGSDNIFDFYLMHGEYESEECVELNRAIMHIIKDRQYVFMADGRIFTRLKIIKDPFYLEYERFISESNNLIEEMYNDKGRKLQDFNIYISDVFPVWLLWSVGFGLNNN